MYNGRGLIAAVLLQALADEASAKPCGWKCFSGENFHQCADEARRFLFSDVGQALIFGLGLRPDLLPEILNRPSLQTRRLPQYDSVNLKNVRRRDRVGEGTRSVV